MTTRFRSALSDRIFKCRRLLSSRPAANLPRSPLINHSLLSRCLQRSKEKEKEWKKERERERWGQTRDVFLVSRTQWEFSRWRHDTRWERNTVKRDGGVKGKEGGRRGKRRIDSLLSPLGDQFSSAWHSNRTRDHVTEDKGLGSSNKFRSLIRFGPCQIIDRRWTASIDRDPRFAATGYSIRCLWISLYCENFTRFLAHVLIPSCWLFFFFPSIFPRTNRCEFLERHRTAMRSRGA